MLGKLPMVDADRNRRYLLEKTQHFVGGFGKGVGELPGVLDILCVLSLSDNVCEQISYTLILGWSHSPSKVNKGWTVLILRFALRIERSNTCTLCRGGRKWNNLPRLDPIENQYTLPDHVLTITNPRSHWNKHLLGEASNWRPDVEFEVFSRRRQIDS